MEIESPASTTKKKRAQWTSEQMDNAVKMVQRGMLSTYAAATRYNIPRRTLRNHLESGSTIRKLGPSAILTVEQEAGLVRRIIRLADVGMPLTPKMLRVQAFSFCNIKKIPNSFNDAKHIAGKKWLRLFLKRHPKTNTKAPKATAKHRGTKRNDNELSWYCPACEEDRADDMRQCGTCGVWYHELCVGLTRADKVFYCSGDCLKKR